MSVMREKARFRIKPVKAAFGADPDAPVRVEGEVVNAVVREPALSVGGGEMLDRPPR